MKAIVLSLAVLFTFQSYAGANDSAKIAAEWQKMRVELRKQGFTVAARVETEREVAADMERVRREMERRAGRPVVSDMQRVGGGGGPVVARQHQRGLQGARGLRK